MDNQNFQKPNVFNRFLLAIKSVPQKIGSSFNKKNRDYVQEEYNYQPEQAGYATNPYQPLQELQEPLTMASAREMSRNAGRRRQSHNTDGAEPVFNSFAQAPEYPQEYPQMSMQEPEFYPNAQQEPYPQMSYPTMQAPNMQFEAPFPTMQPNMHSDRLQQSEPQGFSVNRNPFLDTNIAVFMLLKPEDCHEMLRGIVNPSLYIINMENMLDESVTYCKHVLMGAKLVLNYAIHRISSKNIYMLCPKQINIKMDEVARNLISRYEREPRGYSSESINRDMNKRQEFGF